MDGLTAYDLWFQLNSAIDWLADENLPFTGYRIYEYDEVANIVHRRLEPLTTAVAMAAQEMTAS